MNEQPVPNAAAEAAFPGANPDIKGNPDAAPDKAVVNLDNPEPVSDTNNDINPDPVTITVDGVERKALLRRNGRLFRLIDDTGEPIPGKEGFVEGPVIANQDGTYSVSAVDTVPAGRMPVNTGTAADSQNVNVAGTARTPQESVEADPNAQPSIKASKTPRTPR